MENRTEENNKRGKKDRFNQEKESRLLMMSHRFISVDDPFWELFREKLIHMKGLYAGKHAIHLCSVCLTIFVSGHPKKHRNITIGSLFFQFDPSEKTAREVAELFKDQGRVRTLKSGQLLVGIPSFGQVCIENHRSLEGSTIQFHSSCNKEKTKENEAIQRDTSSLKKRPPRTKIEQQIKAKSVQVKQKKLSWRPTLRAVIPPLSIHKADHLNASPFKQNKATKKEE